MPGTLVWFRNDLRLADNPALAWALARGGPVIPVFLWTPAEEGEWTPGAASKWWLHLSLVSLKAALEKLGSRLVIVSESTASAALSRLIADTGATGITWNRRYEPQIIVRDARIKEELTERGLTVESFNGSLLCEPWQGVKADGTAYQVYSPFWRKQVARGFGTQPVHAPAALPSPIAWPVSHAIESLKLLPTPRWDDGFKHWCPGELGAHQRLEFLIESVVSSYADTRNLPAQRGTSMLSPHLHFGEISSNAVLYAIRSKFSGTPPPPNAETYIKELMWREFGYHLLFYFPHTATEPLNRVFTRFPWVSNADHLRAWQRGQTGYPIVDAGMRELWSTGWMHNRVRMIVASFLVKHLLLPWQAGAAWFWDTLVDADLASNSMGWQWSAGCGADAAPYFRIFNPMLQGAKFDPLGAYVKRWCPELHRLDKRWIHAPWEASASELSVAEIELGASYPRPIVDHGEARDRALGAYKSLRR